MSLFCLSIGVGDYDPTVLESTEKPLACSRSSAQKFTRAISIRFKDAETRVLLDAQASAGRIEKLFRNRLNSQSHDTFLFYFCGHGRPGKLVLGARNPVPELTAETLAGYLNGIKANNIVVVLDCCHAGSVAKILEDTVQTQISIFAATLEDDFAWESEARDITFFTDALVDALNSDKYVPAEDIFGANFKAISERVTSRVILDKDGHRQIPKHYSSKNRNEETPTLWYIIRNRVRTTLFTIAGLLALAALVLMLTTYRVGTDSMGRLAVYYGPKFLSVLNLGPFERRLTTQININSLIDPEIKEQVTSEKIWGVWTKKDEHGVDKWLSSLMVALPPNLINDRSVVLGLVPDESNGFVHMDHKLLTNYFREQDAYSPGELFEVFQMRLREHPVSCDNENYYNFSDPRVAQQIMAAQQSFLLNIALTDWVDYDFLALHTAARKGDHVDYGVSYFRGMQGQPDHFRAEGFFALANAMKLEMLRSGTKPDVNAFKQAFEGIADVGAGCGAASEIWRAYFEVDSISTLETKLWERFDSHLMIDRDVSRAFNEGVIISDIADIRSASHSFDPFFGFEYLASIEELGSTEENRQRWMQFFQDILAEEESFANGTATVGANGYVTLNNIRLFHLGQKARLPDIIVNGMIDYYSDKLHRYTFQNANITYLYLLSNQSPYLSSEQRRSVIEILEHVEKLSDEITANANLTQLARSQGLPARQQPIPTTDRSRLPLAYALDEMWGLMSYGGNIPQKYANRITIRKAEQWDMPPEYNQYNIMQLGLDSRPAVYSRYLAMARYGIRYNIPDETIRFLEDFAQKLLSGELRYAEVYYSPEFNQLYKDPAFQHNVVFLALGKYYYSGIGVEDLPDAVRSRIEQSSRDGRRLNLEQIVAAYWLGHIDAKHHHKLESRIFEMWRTETRSHKKINLGQLLYYQNTGAYNYYSREAKLMRRLATSH